jgi:hypothetical protein
MSNTEYHQQYLQQAIAEQPAPPCDSCSFMHQCGNPDWCPEYLAYIETGEAVRPPRQLPIGEQA